MGDIRAFHCKRVCDKIVHNSISIIKTMTLLYKKKIFTKINDD